MTGPNGDFVQGAPRREFRRRNFNNNNMNNNSGNANGNTNTAMRTRGPRRPRKPANSNGDNDNNDAPTNNDSEGSSGLQVVVHNLSWSTDWRALKEKYVSLSLSLLPLLLPLVW